MFEQSSCSHRLIYIAKLDIILLNDIAALATVVRMEKMSHSLDQFPPEVLDLVLGTKTSSYLALRLWSCGNSILNSKLSSGITYINLKASWSLQIGFPSMLLNLPNLRYLSIKVKGNLMRHPLEWKGLILSLPSTLETLKFVCSDCDYILRNFAPEWTDRTPMYIESDYGTSRSPMIDMSQHLNRLTKLKIFGTRGKDPIPFFARDLPALPSTITDLRVSLQRQGHPLMMSLLPQSLIRLPSSVVGPANQSGVDDWLNCPPNLQHIRTIHYYYPQADFLWIPRTLRHLNIEKMGLNSACFDAQSSLSLPPHYESMVTAAPSPASSTPWTSLLPTHLTSLTVTAGEVHTADLKSLPRSLTSLSMSKLPRQTFDMPQSNEWPPQLRILHLPTIGLIGLMDLPNSLTDFAFSYDGNSIEPMFPDSITSLSIELESMGPFNLSMEGPLPRQLKTFKVSSSTTLTDVRLVHVPSKLTRLDAFTDFKNTDLWATHRCITTLNLRSLGFEAFSELPRSLKSLHAGGFTARRLPKNAHFSQHLPSSLTEIYFGGDGVDWSSESFSNLPLLKAFTAQRFYFPSGILRNLPRSLKKLDTNIKPWSDEDIPFIPPYLEVLGRHRVNWKSPLIAQYWPLADTKDIPEPAMSVIVQRKKLLGIP